MPAQASVHNGQRAPHQTLGTRTRRRGRADAARSEPTSHACAPRNRRASVRHAEDADWCTKLKHLLRKAAARTVEAVWDAIGQLLPAFIPKECANYFQNAG